MGKKQTLGLLFQAEDNYCLLLEEGHNQQVVEKLQTIPLWEETRTRSKFDVESPKTLKSGTINSFIEALTDVWVVETRFNDTFFLTYRSFFSPMSLLNKLLERFDVPQEYHRERNKIQNRVLIALIQWIKDYVRISFPSLFPFPFPLSLPALLPFPDFLSLPSCLNRAIVD